MKENLIKAKTYEFALRIIHTYSQLKNEKEFILSRQLLRSGTSIGANIEEALQAESKADFIHKMAIALKEASETNYWLRLLKDSKLLGNEDADQLISVCSEIQRIITAIIKTSKASPQALKP
jgi:four helix bundle protein